MAEHLLRQALTIVEEEWEPITSLKASAIISALIDTTIKKQVIKTTDIMTQDSTKDQEVEAMKDREASDMIVGNTCQSGLVR